MDDTFEESPVETNNIIEENNSADRNVENSDREISSKHPNEIAEESNSPEQILPDDTPVESKDYTTTGLEAVPSRGSSAMYERSMRQKEERERKLKALQQTLEADFTFAPNRGNKARSRPTSGESVVSSLGDSPSTTGGMSTSESVFSRLYGAETAASRAHQHIASNGNKNESVFASRAPASTAASMADRSCRSAPGTRSTSTKTASARLEFLFKAGEEKLRARHLSDQEEAEQMKRRIENEKLRLPGVYTFRPKTKWNIIAQRRKKASEAKEEETEEERRIIPAIFSSELLPTRKWKASLRNKKKTTAVDKDSNEAEFTFKPKLKWDLIQERRNAEVDPETAETNGNTYMTRAEREKLERDRRYEEKELKFCTFKPNTNWSKSNMTNITVSDSGPDIGIDEKVEAADEKVEEKRVKTTSISSMISPVASPKFVSTDTFSEGVGKDTRVRTIVRRNIAGNIKGVESPQWIKKFREIGQKSKEEEFVAQGQGGMGTVVRGNTVMPTERHAVSSLEPPEVPSLAPKVNQMESTTDDTTEDESKITAEAEAKKEPQTAEAKAAAEKEAKKAEAAAAAAAKAKAEEEAMKKAEAALAARAKAGAAKKAEKEAAAAAKAKAEAEAMKKAEAALAARAKAGSAKKAEEAAAAAAKAKAEAEAAAKKQAEEEAAAAKAKAEAEAAAKKKAEEEEKQRLELEAKKKAEEEEQKRLVEMREAGLLEILKKENERLELEAKKLAEEVEKKRLELEAKRKAEEEYARSPEGLSAKYGAIEDIGERAYQILKDLGMFDRE